MLISQEFYDQLCPSYQKVIKVLDDDLAKFQLDPADVSQPNYHEQELEQLKILEKFFANYLMPKEYWQLYERLDFLNHTFQDLNKREMRRRKAYTHFYFNRNLEPLPQENLDRHLKLLKFTGSQIFCEDEDFTIEPSYIYPHSNLKECFQHYEMNMVSPPSKTLILKYKKMKELYQKIMESEENLEEWFQNIIAVGDSEFIFHNVEYRLGGNLLNKKLWKLYISFLESFNPIKMLEIYSKYCRFFLDDSEMKKEYKEKDEKYGHPSIVKWDTVFDFEEKESKNVGEKNRDSQSFNNKPFIPTTPPQMDKTVLKSFWQNYQNQIFPFQKPLMVYILENADASLWKKLHQTCKYFFSKKSVPICYKLDIKAWNSLFNKESLELNFSDTDEDYVKNTWITTVLFCNYNQSLSKTFLSTIIPRLYQCDAKFITFWSQNLTFNELQFLIGSGNVINLSLSSCRIKDQKNEWINLEDILQFLPNIQELQLSNVKVNKNTTNILAKRKFNSKIGTLILLDIFGEPFDTTEFSNFCTKNRDEKLYLRMEFKPRQPQFSNDFITNFRSLMEDANDLKKTHIEIIFTPM